MQTFRLIPYPANNLPRIQIDGEINRAERQLSIHYEVTGDIDQIVIPVISPFPSRKDDLWKATCFEFFLAIPNKPQYWEFNMSPSGDWNVYKMDVYRRVGFREEKAITELPFVFKMHESKIILDLQVELDPLFQVSQQLQMGITSTIQTIDGDETYWALSHPGPQADFHLRGGFVFSV